MAIHRHAVERGYGGRLSQSVSQSVWMSVCQSVCLDVCSSAVSAVSSIEATEAAPSIVSHSSF